MRHALVVALLTGVALGQVPNGDFENGIDGWSLVDNSGFSKLTHDRKLRALKFMKGGAGGMDVVRCDLRKIPAPGSEFTLKARVKGDAIGNGWFKVFFYDRKGGDLGQGRDVKPLRGTYDFKDLELNLKVPENAATATIFILLVMPGTVWVDDVELTEVAGAKTERPALEDQKIRKWLDANAIPLATLDPDGNLRDLAPLAKQLAGVRIVQLGENTHGDGLAFAAKVRLIRWLHERMDFDVIAFESGLFECERANRLLGPKGDAKAAMRASIFPIWHAKRVAPLFEYMIAQASTRRPMRLTGFDLRKSGTDAKELMADARAFLKADADATPQALLDLAAANRGEREFAFFERALTLAIEEPKFEALEGQERTNVRDRIMAENLKWLAGTRYPDQKIVCWAATAHQAHGLDGVRNDGKAMYDGVTMMGVHTREAFGDKCYTIGFVSHGGWAGLWTMQNFKVPPPREGSMEEILYRYGKSPLFVPLRGNTPFSWPMRMAPMSYGRGIQARWPDVLDAVIYFDEMEPAEHMGD